MLTSNCWVFGLFTGNIDQVLYFVKVFFHKCNLNFLKLLIISGFMVRQEVENVEKVRKMDRNGLKSRCEYPRVLTHFWGVRVPPQGYSEAYVPAFEYPAPPPV